MLVSFKTILSNGSVVVVKYFYFELDARDSRKTRLLLSSDLPHIERLSTVPDTRFALLPHDPFWKDLSL